MKKCVTRGAELRRAAGVVVLALVLVVLSAGARAGGAQTPAGLEPGQVFTLVDGKTEAVVVTGELHKQARLAWVYRGDYPPTASPSPAAEQAARLQAAIEKSTGRKLEVVAESQYKPAAGQPALYLGATTKAQELFADRLKDIDSDGYVVHITPAFVVLAGNVDYAVYDFLSTYLGIDQYIATELFTICPKHGRVVLPVESRIELPAFFSRCLNSFRDGKTYRLHAGVGRYSFHHNIGERFLTVKQFPDHPEYWALVDGKRIPCTGSRTPNPCVLNPEVIAIVTKYCQDCFAKQAGALSVSLAMNDSFRYCQCERCKPLQGPGHSLAIGGQTTAASDYWYTFENAVAKRIQQSNPGKFIGTLAYAHTDNPPTFPVERNILPYFCDDSAEWGNAAERERDLARITAWLERVDRIGLYEYLYGGGYQVPRLYTRNLAEKLRTVAAKCPGSGFYAEVNAGCYGLDGPKLWLVERLLWNPKQDVDALMTRWCTACFGPAAAPMKEYFDSLEAALNRGAARKKMTGIMYGYKTEAQFDFYLPEDFPLFWKLLDEAKAKAGGDETILKRIDYFASALKISDILVQRHCANADGADLMKRRAGVGDVLASLLKHEKDWPRFELWRYMFQLQGEDMLRVGSGPESSRATQAMEYVLDNSAWKAVAEQTAQGTRDAAMLRQAAMAALDRLIAAGAAADPAAAKRVEELRSLAGRVAPARRATKAPVIDGNTDDACWEWNGQAPWFMRNSGMPFPYATDFAMAYDGKNLYVAVRCGGQAGGDKEYYDYALKRDGDKAKQYGCNAKITPSVHIYLDVAGDGKAATMQPYEIIPNIFGGLWEKTKAVESYKTVWNPDKGEWQCEMAIRWDKLKANPADTRYFRLNVVRYVRNQWQRNVGGWYLSHETRLHRDAQPNERGWLVLE